LVIALDTNVLVAAGTQRHPNFEPSLRALEALAGEGFLLPLAALEETYSVLTRLPPSYRLTPAEAWEYLGSVLAKASIRALDAEEGTRHIRSVSERGIVGRMIHDAMIARTAKVHGARLLLTWNIRHFSGLEDGLLVRTPEAWLHEEGQ
jgi:predicted nucleic acid-binding protein